MQYTFNKSVLIKLVENQGPLCHIVRFRCSNVRPEEDVTGERILRMRFWDCVVETALVLELSLCVAELLAAVE